MIMAIFITAICDYTMTIIIINYNEKNKQILNIYFPKQHEKFNEKFNVVSKMASILSK